MKVLQFSAAHGPAECALAVELAVRRCCTEAALAGVAAECLQYRPARHGWASALLALSGDGADALAARWLGTVQWICPSPLRAQHKRKNWFIGVALVPRLPETASVCEADIAYQSCRASGAGGQHVNTTASAVRAVHRPSGVSVWVEGSRSQHHNKKQARTLLLAKLAAQQAQAGAQQRRQQAQQHRQVARGNPVRVFYGMDFAPQQDMPSRDL